MAFCSVLSVGRAFFFSCVGLIFLWPGNAAGSQGCFEVALVASNCAGSEITTRTLEIIDVEEAAPDAYLVPSAVHTPGLNQTLWKTDLRIFNPGDEEVEVTVGFLLENTDHTQVGISFISFNLRAQETRVYYDFVSLFPGIQGESKKGSLRITFGDGTEIVPVITSRTYNDTPGGTFGQFVRAVPIVENDEGFILLTGLSENLYYRSNLSLANFSDREARGVTINVLDDRGEIIGDTIDVSIFSRSTTQIVKVAERAGILTDLDIFSLYVNANGHDLWAGASIVDNATGDPVLVEAVDNSGEVFWVPGIAHVGGVNNSQWGSDITFFNDTLDWMMTSVDYYSPENAQIGGTPGMTLNIASANVADFHDVLGSMLPAGIASRGYFVIKSPDGSPLPQVVAKTYSIDEFGGTFGQNLKVFGSSDLIEAGETGCIAGVSNSSDHRWGFRTNVGVLNTSEDNTAAVEINIYDQAGVLVGRVPNLQVGPGVMVQGNVFYFTHTANVDMDGSVEIKVLSGGPVAAYASVIDNQSQDPILIPAVNCGGGG